MTETLTRKEQPAPRPQETARQSSAAPVRGQPGSLDLAPPGRKLRKRTIGMILGALALLAGTGYGVNYYLWARVHESTDDAFLDAHIVQVSPRVAGHVQKVYVDDNTEVKAGQLLMELDERDYAAKAAQAKATLQLAAARLAAAEATVDLTGRTAGAEREQATAAVSTAGTAIERAKAQRAAAESQHEQAKAGVSAAEAAVAQAQAQVAAAEADLSRAQADVKRYESAKSSGVVSASEYDRATTEEKVNLAKLDAARKSVQAAEAGLGQAKAALAAAASAVGSAEASVGEAQSKLVEAKGRLAQADVVQQRLAVARSERDQAAAALEQAKAELQTATLNLSYTKVYAAQDGWITRKNVEPGNYVQPGQALLALVPHEVWVVANFKETQLAHMHPGDKAEVRVDAYPGLVLHGHVESLQAGTGARFSLLPPENATGNYIKVVQRVPVRIGLDDLGSAGQHLLAPGMSVEPVVEIKP